MSHHTSMSVLTEFFPSRKKSFNVQPHKKIRLEVEPSSVDPKNEVSFQKLQEFEPEHKKSGGFDQGLGKSHLDLNVVSEIDKVIPARKTPKRRALKPDQVEKQLRPSSKKIKLGSVQRKVGEQLITRFLIKESTDSSSSEKPSAKRSLQEALEQEDLAKEISPTAPEKETAPTLLETSFRAPTVVESRVEYTPVPLESLNLEAAIVPPDLTMQIASSSAMDTSNIHTPVPIKANLESLKNQLKSCGKLAELKKCLLNINQSSSKIDTLRDQKRTDLIKSPRKSPLKAKLLSLVDEAEKATSRAPAYERFHSLAMKETNLILPFKYKTLAESFRCADTVLSMLYNRREICTFDKLKSGVQEMMKRTFDNLRLGQIKSVYPTAYTLEIAKGISSFSSNRSKVKEHQLTVTPNLISGNNMNPSALLERRKIFKHNLIELTKKHHEVFLRGLNPPLNVDADSLMRWHPKFQLDKVPDIPPAEIPQIPDAGRVFSAKDVLDRVRGNVTSRMEMALEIVAGKNERAMVEEPPKKPVVTSGLLKGISQSLLDKIRARESENLAREMTRCPESEKKLEMLSRIPEIIRIIRTYFVTERRAAILLDDLALKLSDSYHSSLTLEDCEEHIKLVSVVLPHWLVLVKISKGLFVKVNKNVEVNDLQARIQELIREEKINN